MCRCQEKLRKLSNGDLNIYNQFTIENYAECWSSEKSFNADSFTRSSDCVGAGYKPCQNNRMAECSGKPGVSFLYQVNRRDKLLEEHCHVEKRIICSTRRAQNFSTPFPNFTTSPKYTTSQIVSTTSASLSSASSRQPNTASIIASTSQASTVSSTTPTFDQSKTSTRGSTTKIVYAHLPVKPIEGPSKDPHLPQSSSTISINIHDSTSNNSTSSSSSLQSMDLGTTVLPSNWTQILHSTSLPQTYSKTSDKTSISTFSESQKISRNISSIENHETSRTAISNATHVNTIDASRSASNEKLSTTALKESSMTYDLHASETTTLLSRKSTYISFRPSPLEETTSILQTSSQIMAIYELSKELNSTSVFKENQATSSLTSAPSNVLNSTLPIEEITSIMQTSSQTMATYQISKEPNSASSFRKNLATSHHISSSANEFHLSSSQKETTSIMQTSSQTMATYQISKEPNSTSSFRKNPATSHHISSSANEFHLSSSQKETTSIMQTSSQTMATYQISKEPNSTSSFRKNLATSHHISSSANEFHLSSSQKETTSIMQTSSQTMATYQISKESNSTSSFRKNPATSHHISSSANEFHLSSSQKETTSIMQISSQTMATYQISKEPNSTSSFRKNLATSHHISSSANEFHTPSPQKETTSIRQTSSQIIASYQTSTANEPNSTSIPKASVATTRLSSAPPNEFHSSSSLEESLSTIQTSTPNQMSVSSAIKVAGKPKDKSNIIMCGGKRNSAGTQQSEISIVIFVTKFMFLFIVFLPF